MKNLINDTLNRIVDNKAELARIVAILATSYPQTFLRIAGTEKEIIEQIKSLLLETGNKIKAIKLCYNVTGLNLIESKEYVEKILGSFSETEKAQYVRLRAERNLRTSEFMTD